MSKPSYTLGELAKRLEAECVGDANYDITGLGTLASAGPGELSFLANPKYQKALETTGAGAVLVAPDMVDSSPCHCLITTNPYLAYAKASHLFAPRLQTETGVHASAIVASNVDIHPSASIGAHCTIAEGVKIGAGTILQPGVTVGSDSSIGSDCLIHANASIYHGVNIGDRVTIHSAAVIGSDGFGFAPSPDRQRGGWFKIAQLGGVSIGNDVEIGAGTTIDRGALDNTVIGDRVIIDNQVQIAHNVEIGENTAIAGCVGIAGSTRIGRNCTFAGGVGLVGHITIADGVHVTGMTMVTKSITKPGAYSSGTPMMEAAAWRRSAVRFAQLDKMQRSLSDLKKSLLKKNKQ